jgi:uncharacterized protein (TIGR00255 family)
MHSMTGFGRGTATTDDFIANVELSSVNRKQADVAVQAPRELAELEPQVRRTVLERISRGRVQVIISLERPAEAPVPVRVDTRLARALAAAFTEISDAVDRPVLPVATDFLRQPGIISLEESELDATAAWQTLSPALAQALDGLVSMRVAEGADLKRDLESRLATLAEAAAEAAAAAPRVLVRQREQLFNRLRDARLDLDPADDRVLKELAIFADRCCISEELTRLDAHLGRFREFLASGEPVGRALDFLCQEIHREWNTIGSKANDPDIAATVIDAKAELEKIREQVQNVE